MRKRSKILQNCFQMLIYKYMRFKNQLICRQKAEKSEKFKSCTRENSSDVLAFAEKRDAQNSLFHPRAHTSRRVSRPTWKIPAYLAIGCIHYPGACQHAWTRTREAESMSSEKTIVTPSARQGLVTRKQRDTPFHKSRPSSINNVEGS